MISTPQAKATPVHPLARFVSKEAIALHLKIEVKQIKDIRCWPNVILVVAEGLSKFVSYADLPPILGVEPPTNQDFVYWRKRWKTLKTKQAPDFWLRFYANMFGQSQSVAELYQWGQLISVIKLALSEKAVQTLRSIYAEEKYCLENVRVETRHFASLQIKNRKSNGQPNQRAASLAW
jgi:hypothetical protein